MAIAPSLFSTDPGKIFDFSTKRPAEIFNEAVLPKVNSFLDLLGEDPGGLEEAARRREQTAESDMFAREETDSFLSQMPTPQQDLGEFAMTDVGGYDAPVAQPSVAQPSMAQPLVAQPAGAKVRGAPVAQNLTDFVKHFEGYNPKAYGDFKQTSIGYGTRARKGETSISKVEAEKRLSEELGKARSEVETLNSKHGYNFTPNQMDALTSFAYNVGNVSQLTGGGKRDKETIAQKILEYNKAGGKVLPGLVNRRKAEHNLFTKGY